MTHEEARMKVCAVCTNLWGYKAARKVTPEEEKLIQQDVLEVYTSCNMFFPSGICVRCIHLLTLVKRGDRDVELKLPEDYICQPARETRSSDGEVCSCRWCKLARMSGLKLRQWQNKVKGKEMIKVKRLCQQCYVGILEGSSHKCSASTLEAVINLTKSLPRNLQDKLALEILKQRQAEVAPAQDDCQEILLPQARGGYPVPVLLAKDICAPQPKFSHQELLTMASSAHLTGKQINTVAADLRAKLGQKAVEAGFDTAMVEHNNQYAEYFSAENKMFWDTEGNIIEKAFFWCHRVKDFLDLVARKRGMVLEECNLKIGGDTGKGFLKVTASIYTSNAPTAEKEKKRRRTREEGIGGGKRFVEHGQRMILLLCLVKGVPESEENLELIFTHVKLAGLRFKITGDFKFLMPWFGLLGCSSVHPCLYCNKERRKGEWIEKEGTAVELRTLGGIETMAAAWMEAGSKRTTAWTSKFESSVGMVTVWGEGDTPMTTVLDKCAPPTVHCLLALNSVLRPHLEKIWEGDLWKFLKEEVKVVPHSYQGKDGAFEGPQCDKILNSAEEKLKAHLLALGDPGKLYYEFLTEFKKFKDTFFGTVLPPNYRDVAADFKAKLSLLNTTQGFPITPKLHVMSEHVVEWADKHGRALGQESEQAVEAVHAIFDALWDSFIVTDDESLIFLVNGLKAILKFNADQTNAIHVSLVAEE